VRFVLLKPVVLILAVAGLAGCSASGGGATLAPTVSSNGTIQGADAAGLKVVANLPPPINTQNGATQLIAPNDVIGIDVFQVDDLDTVAQVDSMGNISLPLVGSVRAGGKSVTGLQAELISLYGSRYLQSPQITVSMKESVGQRVTVDGEVRRAGLYPTTAQTSLIQVIAQAGGFSTIADPGKVFVFRDFGGEKLVAQYDVNKIRSGQQADPRIFGGDVVVAFASGSAIFGQNLREALGLATSASGLVL